LYALDHHVERLADDHANARRLPEGLNALDGVRVALERVQTNLVYFELDPSHPLATIHPNRESALVAALDEAGVRITGGAHRLRAVTHLDVTTEAIERALEVFARVLAARSAQG
jgi:threonine aldolase